MSKIVTLADLQQIAPPPPEKSRKTIGLITGCFDILHIGHIFLFSEAKQHVDILVVGLESDEAIRSTKGTDRPIHTIDERLEILASLEQVDYVFEVGNILAHNDLDSDQFYETLTAHIAPTHILTTPKTDRYWKEKQNRAKKLNIEFIALEYNKTHSTTRIHNYLMTQL